MMAPGRNDGLFSPSVMAALADLSISNQTLACCHVIPNDLGQVIQPATSVSFPRLGTASCMTRFAYFSTMSSSAFASSKLC